MTLSNSSKCNPQFMTFNIGSIILIKDYRLPTIIKDKFFIVVGLIGDTVTLTSMTTSKFYADQSLIRHGVIKDRDYSVYCFKANQVIGKNGFYFRKNTFVPHRSNLLKFPLDKIRQLNIEYIDCLTTQEIINIVYSFYKYEYTPKIYKDIFETILNTFTPSKEKSIPKSTIQ